MPLPCPICPCTSDHPAHGLLALLRADDLDAALEQGLLDAQPCATCSAACNARLLAARDARRFALAARARHRARDLRLARLKAERDAARRPAPAAAASPAPALPQSAADALAQALAKARGRQR